MPPLDLMSLLIGAAFGALIAAAVLRLLRPARIVSADPRITELEKDNAGLTARAEERATRLIEIERELDQQRKAAAALREEVAGMAAARAAETQSMTEKLALLEDSKRVLADSFKALSAEALKTNNQSFLDLAKETLATFQEAAKGDLAQRSQAITDLVKPIAESLTKVETNLTEMEKAREGAYRSLHQQAATMMEMATSLRSETANLTKALRAPVVRGRWGEIQLRRVVELAGMLAYCDFDEQVSVAGEAGGKLRPDLVVRLPGGKNLVIDAKAPLEAYLNAVEATDDIQRLQGMKDHARAIRNHVTALAAKSYWTQFQPAPEFVVLFVPGEHFFAAALEHDPALIEAGVEQRVILATPTTLISLLRAVAYGWRQEKLAENARAIAELGRDLYTRLSVMGEHISRVGKGLSGAVDSYNKAVGTLETRVMVSARKFRDLEATPLDRDLDPLAPLDIAPREPRIDGPLLGLVKGGEE